MTGAPSTCPACGSPAFGKYCGACGASLVPRSCASCGGQLSPRARFCHRCGRAVGAEAGGSRLPGRERRAWLAAGVLCAALLALIVFKVIRDARTPVLPDMANAGASATAGARQPAGEPGTGAAPGAPPDISRMTPRERFDRLFNRVMQAADQGDSATALRFTPMALGAYAQLDSADADARYHAAILRMQVGDLPGALALADTILRRNPGHLFGYMIRSQVADVQGDSARKRQATRDFRAHFRAESAAGRPEYREHQPLVDQFRREGDSAISGGR